MAFNRKVELSIGTAGVGLLISGLDISFNIERGLEQDGNTARFLIHNPKEDIIKRVLVEGANIICKAGYEDEGNIGVIFIGTVDKIINKYTNIDTIIELSATDLGSNKQALQFSTINLNYIANSPLSIVILELSSILNIPITGIENVSYVLNNGFVYNGNISGAIKKIRQVLEVEGVGLYFDNSEMVLYKKGVQNPSTFGVVRVTPQNGLVGSPADISDKNAQDNKRRITFTTLLNPRLRPNTVVSLLSDVINGSFICEKVTHEGNNFGDGDFISIVEAHS